jgi:predicted nucleotidyltransferase component of viral defense system
MDLLAQHEKFEMEILNVLNSGRFLDKMVFGGGTMLRLCHEMNRYSADLDFWLSAQVDPDNYLENICRFLEKDFEITDSQNKYFSLLVEARSSDYPKRLKIEIRKEIRNWDMEKCIAFSRFSNRQILLNTHTLNQTMLNKISALTDRHEIRDAFDIEFLLRKGIDLPQMDRNKINSIRNRLNSFRKTDFTVKLGSLLEEEMRTYYTEKGFRYLLEKL